MLDVRNDCCGFLRLRSGIRLCLLLRELARMHYDKAEGLLSYPPFTRLHLHPSQHTLPMPAACFLVLRPARFLHEKRQGGLLTPPGFECLAHGTRTGDEGD
jgi:hypothetical protein